MFVNFNFLSKKNIIITCHQVHLTKQILNQRVPKLGSVAPYLVFRGTIKKNKKHTIAQMKEILYNFLYLTFGFLEKQLNDFCLALKFLMPFVSSFKQDFLPL